MAGTSVCLAHLFYGCGNSFVAPLAQVTVSLQGFTKKAGIQPGQTVLDAIKQVFPYQKNEGSTTINGITGNWRYEVNGIEPEDYAGDHQAIDGDSIALQLI